MRFRVSTRAGVRIALLFVVALVAAPVAQDRLAQDLAQPLDYVPGELLVKFLPDTPPGIANQALALLSGQRLRRFDRIGVEHWRAGRGVSTEAVLDALARPPFQKWIEYAEPNYLRHTAQAYPPDDPLRGDLWSFLNFGQTGGTKGADIRALATWQSQGTGEPIVAVIDTGVDYTHPDLAANMWTCPGSAACVAGTHGKDFVNGDNDPMDDNGHGTHVSGTIAAVANNSIGVMGVSWRARIMALKFLNSGGYGSDANAILAINYARDNGAAIINASWGGRTKGQALSDAINACNCLFVASAGNGGNSKVQYPAGYPLANIISVAATEHNDVLASFSSYGSTWVDLAAPGANIFSTYRGGGYRTMSGTSMAAPHVSGTAALLLANGTALSDVKQQIMSAVDPKPSLAGKMVTGGRLNAARALDPAWLPPPADTVAPGPIGDFVAAQGPPNALTLGWTAPGDDVGAGTVYLYDMRYSTSAITEANWASATPVIGEPFPLVGGSSQAHELENLDASTTYYVGLKAIDEAGNTSLLATATATTQSGPHWEIETIRESDGSSDGFYHALAFDSEDRPAVAFSTTTDLVKFAIKAANGWIFSTVDAGGPGIDLAFNPFSGNPAISHGWGNLRFAESADGGASWQASTLETGPKNDNTSLVFFGGEPWIAYRGGGRRNPPLKLIYRQGGSWVAETVDISSNRYNSLAFDGTGKPAVAFSVDKDGDGWLDTLRLARKSGSSWSTEDVETGTIGYGVLASLAFDGGGNPTIVHSVSGSIRFVRWNGAAWAAEVVASGYGATLAFDPTDGLPTVAYDTSDNSIRWAKRDQNGVWNTEIVDRNADAGWMVQVKFDGFGNPWVLYQDYPTKTLKLARRVEQ